MSESIQTTSQSSEQIPSSDTRSIQERIVAEAESWLNTPFIHQGRIKQRGIDCKNFVEFVIGGAGLNGATLPNNYRPREDGSEMLRLLDEHLVMVPTNQRQAGDVLALIDESLAHPDNPRHLVIVQSVTSATTFVIDATAQGVRRHRLDARWLRRIHSTWRVKETAQ